MVKSQDVPSSIGNGGAAGCRAAHPLLFLLPVLAALTGSTPAWTQTNPATAAARLQAGIEKEDVEGDLSSAMAIFQKIAADASAPRELRAKALLRLAECEERLGRQAAQIYEQIVRDYADQPAAVQARIRLQRLKRLELAALDKSMTVRKIEWSELGFMGSGDTDGKHAIYVASDGNLYLSDLSGRNRRLIFRGREVWPSGIGSFPSRDFSMVALSIREKTAHLPTVAIIKADGTNYRELIRDDSEGNILGGMALGINVNWSWDNRAIMVGSRTKSGGTHLMMIDLASGHREEIASTDSGRIWGARFSPDGRFIAYEILPDFRHESAGRSRIFIKPVHGGEERLIYESPPLDVGNYYAPLKDWTPDGRFIAFRDVQDGKSALYLLPMKDGAPSGPPVFVRPGDYVDGNITMSGALVYLDRVTKPTQASAYFASMEAPDRVSSWQTIELLGGLDYHSHPWPSFSPDGTHIAYIAAGDDESRRKLILQDLATGERRVLYQSGTKNIGCQFSTNTPKVFCTLDFRIESRTDLISIAADTGAIDKITSFQGSRFILEAPLDDRIFHFSGKKADITSGDMDEIGGPPILRWDLASDQEIVVVPAQNAQYSDQPTPDGRWLVRYREESLSVRSVQGGDWKILATGLIESAKWVTSPDGTWIIYHTRDAQDKHGLFRVPITGGTPQRLGDFPSKEFRGSVIRMSADGRKILAVDMQTKQYDLWLLENFEPSSRH